MITEIIHRLFKISPSQFTDLYIITLLSSIPLFTCTAPNTDLHLSPKLNINAKNSPLA